MPQGQGQTYFRIAALKHISRNPTFKNTILFSPQNFPLVSSSSLKPFQGSSFPDLNKAPPAKKTTEPRIKVSAVVKFRISWKSPAFLVLSPYHKTPFSQDILVIHRHSPIRVPSGVIFNSCLSITTQRKGLQPATERIFCQQNKESAGVCGPSRSLRSGAGSSPLPALAWFQNNCGFGNSKAD